ncbi:MAG: C40 family peptidase [Thermoleophilia bacterium]|nr:C40 family peptidase [Thermoleophilia bacterium]
MPTLTRKNPRSVDEAIAWARNQVNNPSKSWDNLCLSFVAHAYGWSGSGVNYAIDHYKNAPATARHDGDTTPPPGALVYWDTGKRAGHVALYLGNGMIASNDVNRQGKIDIVPMSDISKKWGAKYLGWQAPNFPAGG